MAGAAKSARRVTSDVACTAYDKNNHVVPRELRFWKADFSELTA
jgi:hypothetical protein